MSYWSFDHQVSEDDALHYGRKGMKWNKSIYRSTENKKYGVRPKRLSKNLSNARSVWQTSAAKTVTTVQDRNQLDTIKKRFEKTNTNSLSKGVMNTGQEYIDSILDDINARSLNSNAFFSTSRWNKIKDI